MGKVELQIKAYCVPGEALPRADPLAHRERDEELAPLDPRAARAEKPLRPEDIPVFPGVAREQGLRHV